MPGVTVKLKRNDTEPLQHTVRDARGRRVDLTGATAIGWAMRRHGTNLTVQRTATVVGDPTRGDISVPWQAGDLAAVGIYDAEVQVTKPSGAATYPSDGYHTVLIAEDIA